MRRKSAIAASLQAAALLSWVLPPRLDAQPVTIDEQGLDGLTAATAEAWRQPTGGPAVVIDAEAVRLGTSLIALDENAQAGSTGLNLVNAADADAVQAVNIADRGAGTVAGGGSASLEQRNEIAQTADSFALLGSYASPGGLVERQTEETAFATESLRTASRVENMDRRLTGQSVTTRLQAEVVPEFVGLFDTPVSLGGHEISLPDFEIDFSPFDVDFNFGESWIARLFDRIVDVTINIASLEVSGASIRLGEVTLAGNDVIVSGPELTMPSLSFTFCFVARGCSGENGGDPVTVTVGGRTIALAPITLADANPLGDLGMSFGYAIAGDGTISFEAGGVEVTGSIPIDLGLLSGLSFDIDIPEIGVLPGFTGRVEVPVIEIPIDLALDYPLPALAGLEIGGEACVFSQGQQQCTPLDQTIETYEERILSSDESSMIEITQGESHARVVFERRRGELRLEQGQADVVVLRDSELTDRRYRLIIIGGNAQSGVRVGNLVNSATAIVGSGFNLSAERVGVREATGGFESSQSQINSFHQVGGL